MFDNLTDRLASVVKTLSGKGRLSEKNMEDALREVRLALLEADVNFQVVKTFIADVAARAEGKEVQQSLSPGQQVIKIVNEELTGLLGGTSETLRLQKGVTSAIMMVGLQGAGKTTTSAKLARMLQREGRRPYLVPADVYRPAAIEQLRVLGERLGIPVHPSTVQDDPVAICTSAVNAAIQLGADTLLLDTAGRLHVDRELMDELARIKSAVKPTEILLVADAMTGQDAVTVAAQFHSDLDITGVVLTKMDGDARGGAALSISKVSGRPIKFIGTGEGLDGIEAFHPDRMASRILGMGDVLTLIEKAESAVDRQQAKALVGKIRKNSFTLDDFLDQIQQVKKMGSLEQIMGMLPGMQALKKMKDVPKPDERELKRTEAMIRSMTTKERANHKMIDGSRRKRIAFGSGTTVQDVNRLLKSYGEMLKMMKKFTGKPAAFSGGKRRKRPKGMR